MLQIFKSRVVTWVLYEHKNATFSRCSVCQTDYKEENVRG